MQLGPQDLTVTIDGARAPSSTTIAAVGAYVVVIATTLPDQVLQLTSCYLAALNGVDCLVARRRRSPLVVMARAPPAGG